MRRQQRPCRLGVDADCEQPCLLCRRKRNREAQRESRARPGARDGEKQAEARLMQVPHMQAPPARTRHRPFPCPLNPRTCWPSVAALAERCMHTLSLLDAPNAAQKSQVQQLGLVFCLLTLTAHAA